MWEPLAAAAVSIAPVLLPAASAAHVAFVAPILKSNNFDSNSSGEKRKKSVGVSNPSSSPNRLRTTSKQRVSMGEEEKSVKAKQFATDLNSRGVGFSNIILFFSLLCCCCRRLRYHLPGEPNSAVVKKKKKKKKRKSVKGREGDKRNKTKRFLFFGVGFILSLSENRES